MYERIKKWIGELEFIGAKCMSISVSVTFIVHQASDWMA